MRKFILFSFLSFSFLICTSQTPKTYTSSEILLQFKKLNVLGSVLYIAAHPDDENTRLLGYLANEKMYRTGYLSLTRGDGGQNLIGDEQGIDLGLIRTQELLAARRIDGAEQFFTRAYDFGYCKTSQEAMETWNHDKVLSDVVWVIRKFKPDVIIARFPEDSRAGHGHHAASGILAREAFDAAADATKFPEQLQQGVTIWQAKRMLWNTYNFGGNSTQKETQFKVDVGLYNPLLGKGYGEIAALSRSQHKSQGFGVPAQRGSLIEYFETIKGDKPVNDLMDGVDVSWNRAEQKNIEDSIKKIISNYDLQSPSASVKSLVKLYSNISMLTDSYWKQQKLKELQQIIENCSGLFLEATTTEPYAVQGDTLKVTVNANDRLGFVTNDIKANLFNTDVQLDSLKKNVTKNKTIAIYIKEDEKLTQPYWLEETKEKGSFNVSNQQLIGEAENKPLSATFNVNIEGVNFLFAKPIRYKYTDDVKGELYQPLYVVPLITIKTNPELIINKNSSCEITLTSNKNYNNITLGILGGNGFHGAPYFDIKKFKTKSLIIFPFIETNESINHNSISEINFFQDSFVIRGIGSNNYYPIVGALKNQKNIAYDHIPTQTYFKLGDVTYSNIKLENNPLTIGYIKGAGDKVPQALEQMGYTVTMLKENDITIDNIKKFDAIVTGVRAYNTNEWMDNVHETLMNYVQQGGTLVTQYNTNNFISTVPSKIGPYPFAISRTRVTDENAKVIFLMPNHQVLNYPNKITEKDFEGWVQERSIYHAEKIDSNYQRILSMGDANEKEDDGSLIIANFGKGKFVYTGLVFFRELPAGVPGAYRLFANILASPNPSKGGALKKPAKNKKYK